MKKHRYIILFIFLFAIVQVSVLLYGLYRSHSTQQEFIFLNDTLKNNLQQDKKIFELLQKKVEKAEQERIKDSIARKQEKK